MVQSSSTPMTMPQFLSYLKERDTGSQILDAQAKTVKDEYELKQKAFILKNMRQTGEWLSGTEGKREAVSEKDNATASKLYGREYVIKTPEEQQAVINAQNKAFSFAVQTGISGEVIAAFTSSLATISTGSLVAT